MHLGSIGVKGLTTSHGQRHLFAKQGALEANVSHFS